MTGPVLRTSLSSMENAANDDANQKEAPHLVALLKEMKEGLDTVNRKIQSLTAKVKEDQYPTADGFSYLEAKNLLLLNYCQSLVYYLLRKAKGFSIEEHPVIRSIVEIRLFLEKIRPIDKKQQYQIQKLMKVGENATRSEIPSEKEGVASDKAEDVSKYRPNPDMLVSKSDLAAQDGDDVYRPPRFAPASMELERTSKQERNALRREKEILKQAKQSHFIRELMDDMDERPEEVREFEGNSKEVDRYIAKMDERAQQEEELFTRVPLTRQERKREKYLKKSRNGMQGLTESFFDEIKSLPFENKGGEDIMGSSKGGSRNGKLKKRKLNSGGCSSSMLFHHSPNYI
ncbi:neuroguidin isoform X1 [Arachis ipaensis]|uniref:neuroguidin isoform X1 n=1 Tax=Arachis ipaensis TaxID=130454 RepID=UPI0007AFB533|nr:neuroguidin isoform X1 [Arachis ipaensis]